MQQSFQDFEIVFVDNNSSDESISLIEENFKSDKIKIVKSKVNLGFAGGNNLGYKHCSGEYIVLLNNDTIADKDWLKYLLECIKSDHNIGITQSLVLTEGIPAKYYEKNGTVNLLGHNIMRVFEIYAEGIGEIFQANGCSLIIRKELVENLDGLFPDEYFAYSEDTFLCFKVKFQGLKIMHTSKSIVHHLGNSTTKKQNAALMYFYQERNRLLNFFLFFSGNFRFKYIPFLIFNFIMKLILSIVSNKYYASGLIKSYWWIASNTAWLKMNRKKLNALKKADENYVLSYLSGKIFNGENFFEKFINFFSVLYCRIFRINVIELNRK